MEAGSIGEGFGDYLAVTVSDVIAPTAAPACVADRDYCPHLWRTASSAPRGYEPALSGDLNGRVPPRRQIWSRAFWDICNTLGHVIADTIILQAQFSFALIRRCPLRRKPRWIPRRHFMGNADSGHCPTGMFDCGIHVT